MSALPPSGLSRSEAMRLAIAAALAQTHVAFPARVEAIDGETNRVDVRPQFDRATKCIDGSVLREDLPIIASVPVMWPRSNAWGITFPLNVGDFVLVVVADRNIGEWLRTGEAGDPRDVGNHVLDGAVAIPGLYPASGALDDEHVINGLFLGSLAEGGVRIELGSSSIVIGKPGGIQISFNVGSGRVDVSAGAPADFVAKAPALSNVHLAAIATALDAIRATLAGLGAGPATDPNYGAAAKTALDASSPISSSTLRAE